MERMKIAVIYHSETGNTEKVAALIASGAVGVGGVEAKCMSIDSIDEAFVSEARAVVTGCPVSAAQPHQSLFPHISFHRHTKERYPSQGTSAGMRWSGKGM